MDIDIDMGIANCFMFGTRLTFLFSSYAPPPQFLLLDPFLSYLATTDTSADSKYEWAVCTCVLCNTYLHFDVDELDLAWIRTKLKKKNFI